MVGTEQAPPPASRILDALASHWLTLFAIAALGGGVLLSYWSDLPYSWTLALPLTVFAINLGAAIVRRPAFRRNGALLVFHLALLAIILLVAASRMTYLTGWAEVMTGETFSGRLAFDQRAPWHFGDLDKVRFVNEGFTIEYAGNGRRRDTFNRVSYLDRSGNRRSAVIGDDHPLEIAGYRFYTTKQKGFTAAFEWQSGSAAEPALALVAFPSYPANALRQSYEIHLPDALAPAWAQLQLPDNYLRDESPDQFRVPERHHIILRYKDERHELRPGESILLDGNRLRYIELNTWMGYWVHYDWTRHWLLAAVIAAVAALAWHVAGRFARTSWIKPSTLEGA